MQIRRWVEHIGGVAYGRDYPVWTTGLSRIRDNKLRAVVLHFDVLRHGIKIQLYPGRRVVSIGIKAATISCLDDEQFAIHDEEIDTDHLPVGRYATGCRGLKGGDRRLQHVGKAFDRLGFLIGCILDRLARSIEE